MPLQVRDRDLPVLAKCLAAGEPSTNRDYMLEQCAEMAARRRDLETLRGLATVGEGTLWGTAAAAMLAELEPLVAEKGRYRRPAVTARELRTLKRA